MVLKIILVNIFTLSLVSCSESSTSSVDTTASTTPEWTLPTFADQQPTVVLRSPKNILNEMSWPVRMSFLKIITPKHVVEDEPTRRIGIQSLVLPSRRQDESKTDNEKDDQNMKMKLFRLMYESVRDSDLKVKRAELIKNSYTNSSVFEIGYLLGDVTDKFNIMTDMAKTLKRLYHDWKPIEHINAYEQIANLGIDVGHVIDMLRGVEKKMKPGDVDQSPTGGGGGGGGGSGPPALPGNINRNETTPAYFQINKK